MAPAVGAASVLDLVRAGAAGVARTAARVVTAATLDVGSGVAAVSYPARFTTPGVRSSTSSPQPAKTGPHATGHQVEPSSA